MIVIIESIPINPAVLDNGRYGDFVKRFMAELNQEFVLNGLSRVLIRHRNNPPYTLYVISFPLFHKVSYACHK